MKLNGFVGKGTGKLGASVFVVRGGEQIVRQYTDKVSNPNTRAQVEQRAKFKLLTQLSAIVRDALAYVNISQNQSMGNVFMKNNMSVVTVPSGTDTALIATSAIKLSDSAITAPAIIWDVTKGEISGATSATLGWVGMKIAIITTPSVGRVYGVSVVSQEVDPTSGSIDIQFIPSFPEADKTTVLGVFWRYRDEKARAKYENAAASGDDITVAFDRMVRAGEIEVSDTAIATKA